jgi:hypothetical protein
MRRLLIASAAVAALLLGGCGIPDDTPAVPIGQARSTGISAGDDGAPPLPKREDADKPSQLVLNYLRAAAGDPDDALARVKQYLSPSAAAAFKPTTDVRVVDIIGDPLNNPGSADVSFFGRQVGTLGGNGILDPSSDGATSEYKFQVTTVSGSGGLFIAKAPNMILLNDSALASYYELRTIYFWNTEHTALVPDVRYMPKSVPSEQQPTEVLNWLTAGPSTWLTDAVEPLPDGTTTIGNVPVANGDTLQINLSARAVTPGDKAALDRLRRQLMWSLQPNLPRRLELKIGHQVEGDWDQRDYLTSNPSSRLVDDPERFVVYAGSVRRLNRSAFATEPVPVLQPAANKNIRYAALSSSDTHTYAAVVTNDGGKKQSLRVAGAPNDQQAPLRKVNLPGPLGVPVWAVTPQEPPNGAIGLITSNGKLYSFGPGGGNAQQIEWPGGGGAPITNVAVAPDGHRVALVVGHRLYLSVLITGGDALQLGPPQQVFTPMKALTLTAVDWSSEGWLVIGGISPVNNRVALMDMTIDGAQVNTRIPDMGTDPVTYLTAYPASPLDGQQTSDSVSYVTGRGAFDALAGPTSITVNDLAEPVANRPAGVAPSMPLFQH